MTRGVIFTHVGLCHALCEAVASLMGEQSDLVGLSNRDLSGDEMLPALRSAVGEDTDGAIVFTAIYGGSCWQTAERLCREAPQVHHVTGVNLPMLLAFVNKRDAVPAAELAALMAEYGRKGIRP